MRVHVLHVGKTGGSALKAALRALGRPELVLHEHDFTLADVPAGDRAIFALRHPVDRFVSGFYSRQRQGRPLYDVPWSTAEAAAFALFPTANALAEGLGASEAGARGLALGAMRAIAHARTFLSDWLGTPEALRAREGCVLAVLHQPDLDADFARLKVTLCAPGAELPGGVAAHANGPGFDTGLSPEARAALELWYRDDIQLYHAALALRGRLNAIRLAA